MPIQLSRASRLLFIGDSITDCGWRQDQTEQIGNGYVRLIRDWLLAKSPADAPQVINRGISGNKIPDLVKRWDRDVIELSPDVVSVCIGINDVWHGLPPRNAGCSIQDFVAGYSEILSRTRRALPAARLVLCEPSALRLPEPPDADARMEPYADAVRRIGKEFTADAVVPLRAVFAGAYHARPEIAWTTDGVHPTSTGHALIARAWLQATGNT